MKQNLPMVHAQCSASALTRLVGWWLLPALKPGAELQAPLLQLLPLLLWQWPAQH